jgi:hypothetical protein
MSLYLRFAFKTLKQNKILMGKIVEKRFAKYSYLFKMGVDIQNYIVFIVDQ